MNTERSRLMKETQRRGPRPGRARIWSGRQGGDVKNTDKGSVATLGYARPTVWDSETVDIERFRADATA